MPKPSRPNADEMELLQLFRRLSRVKQADVLRAAEDLHAKIQR